MGENWSPEEIAVKKKNQPKILRLIPFAVVFMLSFQYLVLNGHINLAPKIKPSDLKDFQSKVQFTFQYSILGVVWMFFSLWYVISKRFPSPAVNPLSGHEGLTEAAKNILTNSLEQFFLSLVTQLSLISFIDEVTTQRAIPLLNLFYIIGRITFFLGYPENRSFGFWVTMWPTQISLWICLSNFFQVVWGINSSLLSWGIPLAFYGQFYLNMRAHRHKKFD